MSVQGVSLFMGPVVPVPAPAEVLDALDRVEIVTTIGERGSFALLFHVEHGSTLPERFLLESGDLIRIVLSVSTGNDSVAMDGVVAVHTLSAGSQGTQPTLSVAGEDLTLLMDLIDASGRPFSAMSVQTRVQLILAAYAAFGVTPLVVPPPIEEIPTPAERVPQQQGSDYAYLRLLADRTGYRFTLDAGPAGSSVAYWGPEPRADRHDPSLVIDFDQPATVEAFELRFDAMQRVTPEALVLIPASKVTLPIPVPNISAVAPPLRHIVPPAHRHRRLHTTAKLTPAEAAGLLLAKAARSAEAMSGHGARDLAPGQACLRVGQIVEVRGASEAFNGLFLVRRVRHVITSTRHRQEFEVVRAGLGARTVGRP